MADKTQALSALIHNLNNASSTELRAAAAEGLGYIGGFEAMEHLLNTLNTASSTTLRSAAARALGHAVSRS